MDDMERYGDYNEIDDEQGSKNPVLLVIKILIAVLCFAVVGFFIFRIILFNYYPNSMKRLYFNDTLTEYYNETDGKIGAEIQALRFSYDDPEEGNLFADDLIVIRELTVNVTDSLLFYTYHKLVFDGIDFGSEEEPTVEWLRFEIWLDGVEMDEPYMILTYENNSSHNEFTDYELSGSEVTKQ